MLGRETDWRQGFVLTLADALNLSLGTLMDPTKRAVVISHDCDLPKEAEEFVEVIVGTVVDSPDPMLIAARNPRRLHLRFKSAEGKDICLELRQADKRKVARSDFSRLEIGDPGFILSDDEKRALKQWLAARYGRPAFPNSFESRLRKSCGKKSVEQHIAKCLEPDSLYFVGVFFNLNEARFLELPDGEPYSLSITLAYDAVEGGPRARKAAEAAVVNLSKLFLDAYGPSETANEIALEQCEAVADTVMTLADIRRVDHWRLEYISLRTEPIENFLATGETL